MLFLQVEDSVIDKVVVTEVTVEEIVEESDPSVDLSEVEVDEVRFLPSRSEYSADRTLLPYRWRTWWRTRRRIRRRATATRLLEAKCTRNLFHSPIYFATIRLANRHHTCSTDSE